MKYATDSFFDIMYSSRGIKPLTECKTREELNGAVSEMRQKLEHLLGIDKIEAMNFEIKTERGSEKRYDAEILPGLVMPVWILKPEHPNGRNVLYLPGHDEKGAKGSFNYYGQNRTFHKWLPLQLQSEGFAVVIPELIGFGDMIKNDFSAGHNGCYATTGLLSLYGLTTAGMRVYQAMCTVKIMEEIMERPMSLLYGISGGALIAMLYSALSDIPEAVVLSNYGASFKSSIMSIHHCVDNYIHGILNLGECADIIAMSAPRPVMLSNGIEDTIFPADGVNETAAALNRLYEALGVPDRFVNHMHSGGHEADSDAAIAFLKKHCGL